MVKEDRRFVGSFFDQGIRGLLQDGRIHTWIACIQFTVWYLVSPDTTAFRIFAHGLRTQDGKTHFPNPTVVLGFPASSLID